MHFRYVIAAILMFVWFGCGDRESSSDIALVNGKPILYAQFSAYLKFKRIPTQDESSLDKIADRYIENEALSAVITDESLLNKELIEAELNEFKKEMVISRYFEKFLNENVSDEAVKNYYNTHATDFEEKKAHIAHILIRTNPNMSEPERKAKLTTLQEAFAHIRSGKAFEEISKTYSEDKVSAGKGGDLGWIKEGSIDPVFSKTAFELKPGSVSEPFETPFGFHVVKLIEGPQTVKRPLEAVMGDIRYQLRNQAKKAELDRLMAKAKVIKHPKAQKERN